MSFFLHARIKKKIKYFISVEIKVCAQIRVDDLSKILSSARGHILISSGDRRGGGEWY